MCDELVKYLRLGDWRVVTAESCTGGGLAYQLTSIPGSSRWFERGFVTYSNEAKQELLGVSPVTLANFGAVSEQVAIEMAEGALRHSRANIALAITGIAGPDGGSPEKPVGTVWFGLASHERLSAVCRSFAGDRALIRQQAIDFAVVLLSTVRLVSEGVMRHNEANPHFISKL